MKKIIAVIMVICLLACACSSTALAGSFDENNNAEKDDLADIAIAFCDFENVTGGSFGSFSIADTGDAEHGKAFCIPATGTNWGARTGSQIGASYTYEGKNLPLFKEALETNTYYILEYDYKSIVTEDGKLYNDGYFSFAPQLEDFRYAPGKDQRDYPVASSSWKHYKIAFNSGSLTTIDIKANNCGTNIVSYIDNYRLSKAVKLDAGEVPVECEQIIGRKGSTEKCLPYGVEVKLQATVSLGEELVYEMGDDEFTSLDGSFSFVPTADVYLSSRFSLNSFKNALPYVVEDEKIYVTPGEYVSDILDSANMEIGRMKYYSPDGWLSSFCQMRAGGRIEIWHNECPQGSWAVKFLGDANSDDQLTVTDIVSSVEGIIKGETRLALDMNKDEAVTVTDAVALRKNILKPYDGFEEDDGVLKVFSIGNSYSQDSVTRLREVALACGYENFIFAFVSVSGSKLENHYANLQSGSSEYSFYKYDKTGLIESANKEKTLEYAIKNENWDIITFQQGSTHSGKADSVEPYLKPLAKMIRERATNKDLRIYWHETWAYQKDSEYISNYGTQEQMFSAIIDVVQNTVEPTGIYTKIIPNGTAVQNMRTTIVGDNMQRDGLHLNLNYARLLASCVWFKTLVPEADLSKILTDSTCLSTLRAGVSDLAALGITVSSEDLGKLIIKSVEAAVRNPYEVTTITLD